MKDALRAKQTTMREAIVHSEANIGEQAVFKYSLRCEANDYARINFAEGSEHRRAGRFQIFTSARSTPVCATQSHTVKQTRASRRFLNMHLGERQTRMARQSQTAKQTSESRLLIIHFGPKQTHPREAIPHSEAHIEEQAGFPASRLPNN